MNDIVNTRIEFHEPFRPFVPWHWKSTSRSPAWASATHRIIRPWRYMLMRFASLQDKQALLPAVTHHGGTGRLQTVRREWHRPPNRVVEHLAEETGLPVLFNTYSGLCGEPIVNTPQNALSTSSKSGVDTLCTPNFILRKG